MARRADRPPGGRREPRIVASSAARRGWARRSEDAVGGPRCLPSCWSRPPSSRGRRGPPRPAARGDRPVRPRRRPAAGRAARRASSGGSASLPWGSVFAVPVLDVHSPCRLHRREKLAAIPLQSASSFLDVEILAKATFLGHLIDEVDVPAAAPATVARAGLGRPGRRSSADPVLVRRPAQVQRKIRRASEKVTTAQAARIARAVRMSRSKQPGPFEDHPAQGARPAGSGAGPG